VFVDKKYEGNICYDWSTQCDHDLGLEQTWIQCDECKAWVHAECLTTEVDETQPFSCPERVR